MREQAARWYDDVAAARGGAIGVTFRKFAKRIRNGDADHRLREVIAGQADYDAEQTPN